ncbi:HAD family phosphatase [Clostridia bacterium]|nr:HAD family phosphatase [Clostridia bacterium]
MKTTIKMVAIDLDGTLLQDDLKISMQDRHAIDRARRRGVKVVIATGRMYSTTVKYARDLDLDTPLICFNGAYITDIENKKKLEHYLISMEYAKRIHQEVTRRGIHANYYLEDDIHVAELTELAARYQERLAVPIHVEQDMQAFFEAHEELTKITIQSKEEEEINSMARWIEKVWPKELYIVRSNAHFLEVSHPGITKATGVKRVAEEFGVQQEEIMCIGDNHNDLSMLEYAGIGVAMGNADSEIKDKSDFVTECNKNNGVGLAIEKFVLED